jgi:Na+-translocating ferredoxin:NAD+ oxidoreductase RnfC subunit
VCTELCPRALLGFPVEPHAAVRALTATGADPTAAGISACSLCGLCDVVCPTGLAPRRLYARLREGLGAADAASEAPKQVPSSLREARSISIERLTARLGLLDYQRPLAFDPQPLA